LEDIDGLLDDIIFTLQSFDVVVKSSKINVTLSLKCIKSISELSKLSGPFVNVVVKDFEFVGYNGKFTIKSNNLAVGISNSLVKLFNLVIVFLDT
jgi:hypothetical protein